MAAIGTIWARHQGSGVVLAPAISCALDLTGIVLLQAVPLTVSFGRVGRRAPEGATLLDVSRDSH